MSEQQLHDSIQLNQEVFFDLQTHEKENPEVTSQTLCLKVSPVFSGLTNQGATCYANSALQQIFRSPNFLDTLLSLNLTANPELFTIQTFFAEMAVSSSRAVNTRNLWSRLTDQTGRLYNTHMMQDSFEFFVDFLTKLDTIEPELRNPFVINFETSIYNLETGELQPDSITPDQFLGLSLDVTNDLNAIHLTECLSTFFSPTRMTYHQDDDISFTARIQYTFFQPPKILVLHMKRIVLGRYGLCKRVQIVNFDEELDLTEYFTQDSHLAVYQLRGLITHGGGGNGGHFSSFCFDVYTQKWIHLNDSYAGEVSFQEVYRQNSGEIRSVNRNTDYNSCTAAYVFFYHRKDIPPFSREIPVNQDIFKSVQKPVTSFRTKHKY